MKSGKLGKPYLPNCRPAGSLGQPYWEIFVRKVAPLGDPIEINVRGYELSLRKADAEMIEIR